MLLGLNWLSGRFERANLRNIVFMGMGEPLMNFANLIRSLRVISDPRGFGFSRRRITVSTVGLPKVLEELGRTDLASLAVSLHAPTQDLREKIMPKAARVPISRLMAALRAFPRRERQRITFEYLLLADVNDAPEQARQLVRLIAGIKSKVNLIGFNPGRTDLAGADGRPFRPSSPERILTFQKILRDSGLIAVLRKSKGSDIKAACGQLLPVRAL